MNDEQEALKELLEETSYAQSFLADVRQAMWEPAFNQKEEWARNWFFKAEKVAVNLSIAQEKADAILSGREPDPYVGTMHDVR
jgi:hypothetical protein